MSGTLETTCSSVTLCFLSPLGWEFCFQAILPAAKHPSYLVHVFGKHRVFFGINQFVFPTDLEEEFQKIEFANSYFLLS